jgi:hypothetical protein
VTKTEGWKTVGGTTSRNPATRETVVVRRLRKKWYDKKWIVFRKTARSQW